MDDLISLLIGLSDSQVWAFRHTSTLAGEHSHNSVGYPEISGFPPASMLLYLVAFILDSPPTAYQWTQERGDHSNDSQFLYLPRTYFWQ